MSVVATQRPNGSRLWPLLTVLVFLIGSAVVLEIYARTRDPQAIVVVVGSGGAAELANEATGDDEGREVEADTSAPLNAAHSHARELGRRGDVTGALAELATLIAQTPEEPALYADQGYFLLLEGRSEQALAALERARSLGSSNPSCLLNLGVALRRLDRLTEAERVLGEALAIKPVFRAARLALSTVLRRQGRYDEAIAILNELTTSGGNAGRARALLGLGRAQLAAHRSEAADQAFERAIEWMPAESALRVSIARAYLAEGGAEQVAKGRAAAEIAVELAPDVPEAQAALGRAKELSGDLDGAEQAYESALRLQPDSYYVRRRLLRLALDARNYEKARAQAEQLLAQAPEQSEHHFLAGLVAARSDEPDQARAHYEKAIEVAGGTYPEAYFNLGVLEKSVDRLPEAIAAYEQAVGQKADYLSAYNNLGLAHALLGEDDKAEAAYRSALKVDVNYAAAWINLGKLELHRKRFDQAITAFERAIAARPKAYDAMLNLGVAYRKAGKIDEAVAVYRKLLALQPRYASAWYNLGVALERSSALQEARQAYEQALLNDNDHVLARRSLAALFVVQGDLQAGRAQYQTVIDHDPSDAKAWIALADIARRQGDVAVCTRSVHAAVASVMI